MVDHIGIPVDGGSADQLAGAAGAASGSLNILPDGAAGALVAA